MKMLAGETAGCARSLRRQPPRLPWIHASVSRSCIRPATGAAGTCTFAQGRVRAGTDQVAADQPQANREVRRASSFLVGLVGGQRAMTPVAAVAVAVAVAVAIERLPPSKGAPRILSYPIVTAGAVALAAGNKAKAAPDRIVLTGVTARFVTSAIAGACLASHRQRWLRAAVCGATGAIAGTSGWRARVNWMERGSQTSTGFLEGAAVLAAATAITCRLGSRIGRWRSRSCGN